MNYGFNDDKEKIEVYPASEVYTKNEVYSKSEAFPKNEIVTVTATLTVPAGETANVTLGPEQLEAFGMENGNPENYMLIAIERKSGVSGSLWSKSLYISDGLIYPRVSYVPFGAGRFQLKIYLTNSGSDADTYSIRAKFIKV